MSTTIEPPRVSWQGVEMSAKAFLALPGEAFTVNLSADECAKIAICGKAERKELT